MRTLLLLCLLLSNPALAEDRLQVEGYLLENGLQLLLKPTAERGHVAIRLVVGVGFDNFACAEKELPHLLEHLLFSGIDASGEAGLEARMQALGGEWNAYTRDADTSFVIEAPAKQQRAVLDLLLASLFNSELDERKVAAAKRVVERENGGHYSNLQRLLDQHNLGREAHQQLAVELGLSCAERAPLAPLGLEQLEQLRRDWYAPNNMTLILVGDLDPRLPAYLDRSFGALPAAELPEPRELPSATHKAEARRRLFDGLVGDRVSLHWIFPEPWVGEHDAQAWELLSAYLDWQLYRQLRIEHGLAYGPWSERNVYGGSSFFSLNAEIWPPPNSCYVPWWRTSNNTASTLQPGGACNRPPWPSRPGPYRATVPWPRITGTPWATTMRVISAIPPNSCRRSAWNRPMRPSASCSSSPVIFGLNSRC